MGERLTKIGLKILTTIPCILGFHKKVSVPRKTTAVIYRESCAWCNRGMGSWRWNTSNIPPPRRRNITDEEYQEDLEGWKKYCEETEEEFIRTGKQ